MDDQLLTRPEVEALVRLRRSALYRLLRDPASGFLLPLRIGQKAVRWRASEIREWIDAQPRATGQAGEDAA
ncbi:MAG: AlpA family phage regulatory protein [Bryobacterales bacterium]|nr:AlpA family phage regulatory protein [Bryobacterales bacterium]